MIFHPWYRYFGRLQGETCRTGGILTHNTTSKFIRNLNIPQDSRERLGRQVESWQVFCCCILMKLSQKLLNDDPYQMSPPPCSSRTSTSSKTPGETWRTGGVLTGFVMLDLDETYKSFWSMIPTICHHLEVHQEPPHPLRLLGETWRTGGALTGFLLFPSFSGTSTSSKTPGRDLEDRWSLDRVCDVGSWWNLHRSFWSMIPIIWHHLQVHQESPHPPRLLEETWRPPCSSETLASSRTP